jgi:hypothetical protein
MLRQGLTDQQQELVRWMAETCCRTNVATWDWSRNPGQSFDGDLGAGNPREKIRAAWVDVLNIEKEGFIKFIAEPSYYGGQGFVNEKAFQAVATSFGRITPVSDFTLTPAAKVLALRIAALPQSSRLITLQENSPEGSGFKLADDSFIPATAAQLHELESAGLVRLRASSSGVSAIIDPPLQTAKSRMFGLRREQLVLEIAHVLANGDSSFSVSEKEIASLMGVGIDRVNATLSMLEKSGLVDQTLSDGFYLTDAGICAVEDPPAPGGATPTNSLTVNVQTVHGGLAASAAGNASISHGADAAAIVRELRKLTAELVAALRDSLPAEDASQAEADAGAVLAELSKDQPDANAVAKKSRSILTRISDGMLGGVDFIERGEKLAAAAVKYGGWVALAWQGLRAQAGT